VNGELEDKEPQDRPEGDAQEIFPQLLRVKDDDEQDDQGGKEQNLDENPDRPAQPG
jgi:hypothetical protein